MLAFLVAAFHTGAVASAVAVENRLEGILGHPEEPQMVAARSPAESSCSTK